MSEITTTIVFDPSGLTEYGCEEPTNELRFVAKRLPHQEQQSRVLQQKFLVGFSTNGSGRRVSENFQWRDVPLVDESI